MKNKLKPIIDIVIILICVIFTYAVLKSSAENSLLEIQEQYLNFKTKTLANELKTYISIGLDINSYSGIDDIAKNAAEYNSEHIDAVILDENNIPIATSFDMTADDGAERLSYAFSAIPLLKVRAVTEDIGNRRIIAQPFASKKNFGHIVLIYDKDSFSDINTLRLIKFYKSAIDNIAGLVLKDITEEVSSLYDSGLKPEDIADVKDNFSSKLSDFGLIDSMTLGYNVEGEYIGTAFSTSQGDFNVGINTNPDYIRKTNMWIFFTLVAALIICIMIVIEFLHLRKIIKIKISGLDEIQTARTVPVLIRFISFFVYLSAYASLPYGAIIISSKGESLLGLPVSVCASLPVTLEAIALFIMLSLSPVIFNKTGIKKYTIITGLCTAIPSLVCFLFNNIYTIIICSVFLGVTQGLLKYLMNYLISVCSKNAEDISINYGEFNIGTLTGITVGGSLGGIIAADKGYTAVYMASAAIMAVITITVLICMPYGYIRDIDSRQKAERKTTSYSAFLKQLLCSPLLLLNMIFSVGVVAIALMFIVAFMPVALNLKGLSPMISTYGFLIYGIAGNYISGYMLKKSKTLKRKTAAFISMLIIAAAVLIIIPEINAFTILTASLLAGLFDGYGAPSVTSALMNNKKAKATDSALMLTGTALIGGIGNAAAPVIYSTILYSDNISVNLCLLLVFFIISGIYILNMKD